MNIQAKDVRVQCSTGLPTEQTDDVESGKLTMAAI
jgi:hypothetical protein